MTRVCKTLLAASLTLSFASVATAADHLDSPIVKGDPSADITDYFAFVNPNDPGETILIFDWFPLATANSEFSDVVKFAFHIDNGSGEQIITCMFPNNGTRVHCEGAGLSAGGALNQVNDGGDLRVFAGLADDPFFFDFVAFQETKATLMPQFTNPGTNFFKGLNVETIALGIQSDAITNDGANTVLKTFITTERVGGAGINGGFTGAWYDPANSGHGFNLQILPPLEEGGNRRMWMLWAVYDAAGNQSWVAGLTEFEGSHVVIDNAYVTENGAFPPSLMENMPTNKLWGSITFDFSDCNTGMVHYDGSGAGLPAGEFPIARLTSIDGLDCSLTQAGRLDRNGRPGISTVLIDLLSPYSTTLKDDYNTAFMPEWPTFTSEIEASLTALDTLDGVTGNTVLPPEALAPVLADDRLIIDVSIPTCGAYLAVELSVAGQCGGRALATDFVDATLGAIVGPGVSDYVGNDSNFRESFPFIGTPN